MSSPEQLVKWTTEYKKGFAKPFILLSLAKKTNYPYSLTREINSLTKGQIAITGSNIYPILKDLVDEGLINKEKVPKPSKRSDTAKKQYRSEYSLTKEGEELIVDLKQSLKEFVDIITDFIEE
ncbi:MAG: PadR family transcriptional regulator [Candidatus Heimdallarchaeota archaeon]|nr:MAG: PadR family transcriptional regulator [Candidatus Heimdallarchaeota archaeon]